MNRGSNLRNKIVRRLEIVVKQIIWRKTDFYHPAKSTTDNRHLSPINCVGKLTTTSWWRCYHWVPLTMSVKNNMLGGGANDFNVFQFGYLKRFSEDFCSNITICYLWQYCEDSCPEFCDNCILIMVTESSRFFFYDNSTINSVRIMSKIKLKTYKKWIKHL